VYKRKRIDEKGLLTCMDRGNQAGQVKCSMDPYFIMPDRCKCVDFQVLKMQESPDAVPAGEMPRHMQLYVDRYLCDKVVPGNRISVYGIYSIKKVMQFGKVLLNSFIA
jgi:DNA replication licensing factor MCM5